MRLRKIRTAAAVLIAVSVPVIGVSAPAHADSCITQWKYTSTSPDFSESFNASIDCDGVWGLRTWSYNDWIGGEYYKDGGWHNSTLGDQYITANSNLKLVGNTVDGRRCRGDAKVYNQKVSYKS
jgi:hypothetical protein